jgi:2-keto-4-pentenoate hydratase/2-oxohepta-3-ene-1,7-dioic acid hydratase in catechol pathway
MIVGTFRSSGIIVKLLRYSLKQEPRTLARLGLLITPDRIADLRAGYALHLTRRAGHPKGNELAELYMPRYITEFLHMGEQAWIALADAYTYLIDLIATEPDALGLNHEPVFLPLAQCRVYAPVRPSKLIAVGRNYPGYTQHPGKAPGKIPTGFIKTLSSIAGPGRDIIKPRITQALDCETELAVVIGKRCKDVPEDKAYDVIAGYTIVNDITARDLGALEKQGGHMFLAKTFDTFTPLGPWMITRDAIPDPMHLRIQTRVNGETRQDGNTRDMLFPIPQLIAHFSQITLMPGDIISTGSPGGGALANPDWFLNAGDIIESEIEGIGILTNGVVDEPPG